MSLTIPSTEASQVRSSISHHFHKAWICQIISLLGPYRWRLAGSSNFPDAIAEILDPTMLQNDIDGGNSEMIQSCVLPMLKLGLLCSMVSPRDRLGMGQVSAAIVDIKHAFLELYSGGISVSDM